MEPQASASSSSDSSPIAIIFAIIGLIVVIVLVYFLFFQGQTRNNAPIEEDSTPTEDVEEVVPDSTSRTRFVV